MNFNLILENFLHPSTLFFFLGMVAVFVRSDLEIPSQVSKFLSIYLLFNIGIKGGQELFHSGFNRQVVVVVLVCVISSFLIPFLIFPILKRKLSIYDAGAVAATYGSISAVTFATAIAFLEAQKIEYGGYMVAGMALMESPAIIAGLILIKLNRSKDDQKNTTGGGFRQVVHESMFNGSVLLLIGSLVIGYLSGEAGEKELNPFIYGIFFGMLSLYMLDMGLVAASRIRELKRNGLFVVSFALLYPVIFGLFSIWLSYILGYSEGDALLQTVLIASGSYIAVPAAMRMAVPKANMGVVLPMALGLTFTLNISIGIPFYYFLIQSVW